MEIKVLRRSENELRLEVVGESHTLLNLLQKELVRDPAVEIGGYEVVHPLERPVRSIFYVRTKGEKKPEEAILDAVARAREMGREFAAKFEEALARLPRAEESGQGEGEAADEA